MKLIIIYGPPAVGKLTVAKELAKITRFKILDNHAILDSLIPIFGISLEDKELRNLFDKIRLDIIKTAVDRGISLILTEVFYEEFQDNFLENHKKITNLGVEIEYVRLNCDREKLFKRVNSRSRKNFNKIKDVNLLKEVLEKYTAGSEFSKVNNLNIENTNISAKKAAKIIKEKLRLD